MKRALVLVLASCGRAPAHEVTPPTPAETRSAAVRKAPALAPIPATAQHLITGVIDAWDATAVTLRLYARDQGAWRLVGAPWPGVIGKAGAAWGAGLHGTGAPSGRAGPRKHEGDGKAPAGVFALRGSYGYAARPPAGTSLPYLQVDERTECVDDPASRHYASILAHDAAADWKSAEHMRRPDDLYTWVIDIAHNPAHTAGDGSCIFFHVWSGPASTTVGCTAMAEPALTGLLATLDAGAVYVLLPRADYEALTAAWQLPPL